MSYPLNTSVVNDSIDFISGDTWLDNSVRFI